MLVRTLSTPVEAFDRAWTRSERYLRRIATRFGPGDEVDDVLQEAAVQCWTEHPGFASKGIPFEVWAGARVKERAWKRRRYWSQACRAGTTPMDADPEGVAEVPDPTPGALEGLLEETVSPALVASIDALTDRQRLSIEMVRDGREIPDLATALGLSEPGAQLVLRSARERAMGELRRRDRDLLRQCRRGRPRMPGLVDPDAEPEAEAWRLLPGPYRDAVRTFAASEMAKASAIGVCRPVGLGTQRLHTTLARTGAELRLMVAMVASGDLS